MYTGVYGGRWVYVLLILLPYMRTCENLDSTLVYQGIMEE